MNKTCTKHVEESKSQLRSGGLKVTSGRLAILDVFKHASKPLSAKDIAAQLPSWKVDLATIYRNIESLTSQNILVEINLKKDTTHYELKGSHHHHIICEKCGTLKEVSDCGLESMQRQILKTTGFAQVNRHSLEFFGLCPKCAKKNT